MSEKYGISSDTTREVATSRVVSLLIPYFSLIDFPESHCLGSLLLYMAELQKLLLKARSSVGA